MIKPQHLSGEAGTSQGAYTGAIAVAECGGMPVRRPSTRVSLRDLGRRLCHLVGWLRPPGAVREWLHGAVTSPSVFWFAYRNRCVADPVWGDAPVVVSLTSYGRRARAVHLVVEAIARGSVRPRRLILWLADAEAVAHPPAPLARLVERGLEIRHAEDWGPHKKYYPYACSEARHEVPLVTADDDVFYGETWLAELLVAHEAHPDDVIAHRAHRVGMQQGKILPYTLWAPGVPPEASYRTFATGISGVLYPPRMLDLLREAGNAFAGCAPRGDDVWLHATAVRHGVRVRPVRDGRTSYRPLPGALFRGLKFRNVLGGGNDAQIAATYTPEAVARMWREHIGKP